MSLLNLVTDRLRAARRVTALTGAGVSAASGIPTFRGENGLWKSVRADMLATAGAFKHDPKLVWEWYGWRRALIARAEPNAAHHILAQWTHDRPGFTLITQNVDGLHERAGADRLIRLHGSIWHVRCWNACPSGTLDWRDDTVPQPCLPPRCPHCGGVVRPGVVWFGESLDPVIVAAARAAARECDVFLTIGTSAIVHPAAGLVHEARRHGAFTVEINVHTTEASAGVDLVLSGPAEDILPQIHW